MLERRHLWSLLTRRRALNPAPALNRSRSPHGRRHALTFDLRDQGFVFVPHTPGHVSVGRPEAKPSARCHEEESERGTIRELSAAGSLPQSATLDRGI